MTKQKLAKQLRERIVNTGEVTQREVNCMSDDDMIDAFNTCSCCGEKFLSSLDLQLAIESSSNSDEFIEISKILEYQRKTVSGN